MNSLWGVRHGFEGLTCRIAGDVVRIKSVYSGCQKTVLARHVNQGIIGPS